MIKTDLDSDFYEVSKTVFIFQIRSFVIEILRDKVEALVRESDAQRKTLVFGLIFKKLWQGQQIVIYIIINL